MSYRITNSMMVNKSLINLNRNMHAMDSWNEQLHTTKRINNLSDDPVGLVIGMNARAHIYRLETYQENLSTADMYVKESEEGLKSYNSLVQRAYELTIDAATDVKTPGDRKLIAEEIMQIMKGIVDAGNFVADGRYVFAGFNTVNDKQDTKKPFIVNSAGVLEYNGVAMVSGTADYNEEIVQKLQIEVGFNSAWMEVSLNGFEVMGTGEKNIYEVLRQMHTAMTNEIRVTNVANAAQGKDITFEIVDYKGNVVDTQVQNVSSYKIGDQITIDFGTDKGIGTVSLKNMKKEIDFTAPNADILAALQGDVDGQGISTASHINPFISRLQEQLDRNLANMAVLGGWTNRIDMLEFRYNAEIVNYTERMSNVEDADMAEAAVKLKSTEAVYQAALAACARIIQPTLLDYMR